MLRGFFLAILRPFRILPWRVLMLISPRWECHGVLVFDCSRARLSAETHFAAVDRALGLISTYQPRRLARFRQDVRRILILEHLGNEFWPDLRACVLTPTRLVNETTAVAMAIVHEGTHARLLTCGIGYPRELRARIERFCIRQEIDFATRVPGGSSHIETSLQQLETPWWNDSDLFERRMGLLRGAGTPAFLMRVVRAIFAPR